MRMHRIGGNCVLLGPMLIPEWTEFSGLFGIAGNRVLLAIFASLLVFLGLIASIFCHVRYSVFRIPQSLFFWELIFCMFSTE